MFALPALLRTPNWSLSNKDRAGIHSARRPCPGREDLSKTPRRLQIVLAKKRSGPLRSEPRHFSDPTSRPCPPACPIPHGRRVPALFVPRKHRFPPPPPAYPSFDTDRRGEFGCLGSPVPPAATFSASRLLRSGDYALNEFPRVARRAAGPRSASLAARRGLRAVRAAK